uniref:Proline-rich receptor-like protein kinase PERK5 n=1 Tax=Crassostrea virginica TaxID=6565 RepID=A0A8B8ESK1_CRAVI|nr:proline-rich receptor-like protein kinase PERK5 [Crassostrea virginica]
MYFMTFLVLFTGPLVSHSIVLNDEVPKDASALSVTRTGPCSALVESYGEINLKPLTRRDGLASFYSTLQYNGEAYNYTYNPCQPFNEPLNPHQDDENRFGDGCSYVTLCKFTYEAKRYFYYPYGVQNEQSPLFSGEVDKNSQTPSIMMTYTGSRSMSNKKSRIYLKCNRSLHNPEDARFVLLVDNPRVGVEAELHHVCACPGGCKGGKLPKRVQTKVERNSETSENKGNQSSGKKILLILGVNIGILVLAGCVGFTCYSKRSSLQMYYKVPGGRANTDHVMAMDSHDISDVASAPMVSGPAEPRPSAYRDYEPDNSRQKMKKMNIPVLDNCLISNESLQMSQRLGGGVFSDTNAGDYCGIKVAVTRITLNIHENQISQETLNWMKEEVWGLSRQRHRFLVSMLGICVENRLPYIVSEFVDGQSVKYYINSRSESLTWPQRVKICMQAADGMAYLHSSKPTILHRDLRCANIFINNHDVVKVADFGLVKLIQPLRTICEQEDCCCQGQFSGCPSSLRWTAPEVIQHPRALENDVDSPHTIYSDVYSFGMCMWELAVCEDPFGDISEQEVMEVVKQGARPDSMPSGSPVEVMPQYRALMHTCWNTNPDNRPKFTQVATRLKEILSSARTYQKNNVAKKKQVNNSASGSSS